MPVTPQSSARLDRELPPTLQSPRAKLVYLYLTTGEASVDTLQADLGIKKTGLFPILRALTSDDLVERTDDETFRCR